jgi:hypothetical protein
MDPAGEEGRYRRAVSIDDGISNVPLQLNE